MPDGPQLRVAGAHREARLARAQDAAVDEVQEVPVLGVDGDAAEVAAVGADRGRSARPAQAPAPATAAAGGVPPVPRRSPSGERDLVRVPVAAQQRHRAELTPRRPRRARRAAGRTRSRTTRTSAAAPPATASRERRVAGGAAVAIGEDGAVDVRDDEVDAPERERAERPRADRAGLGERQPAGRRRRLVRRA